VKLYSYFRSSAAYRVRIALNLKGVRFETIPVELVHERQHRSSEYRSINPQMRVPALVLSGGEVLTQSMAIIEYLDEAYPDPPLLPPEAVARARVRAIAQTISCDIHPLNNSGTLAYLRRLGQDEATISAWYSDWVRAAFDAIETMLRPGPYSCGSHVSIADLCLVPQVYNAVRFNVPLVDYPKINKVNAACLKLPAFERALPENQPDAE
jgi:maleylacetoacetate isomerase